MLSHIEELVRCRLDDTTDSVVFKQFDQIGGRRRRKKHGKARALHEASVVEYLTKREANTHAVGRPFGFIQDVLCDIRQIAVERG